MYMFCNFKFVLILWPFYLVEIDRNMAYVHENKIMPKNEKTKKLMNLNQWLAPVWLDRKMAYLHEDKIMPKM